MSQASWLKQIKQIPLPWGHWLSSTQLFITPRKEGALVVPSSMYTLANSLEFLRYAYQAAKTVEPALGSLVVVTGTHWDLVNDGELELQDIRILN